MKSEDAAQLLRQLSVAIFTDVEPYKLIGRSNKAISMECEEIARFIEKDEAEATRLRARVAELAGALRCIDMSAVVSMDAYHLRGMDDVVSDLDEIATIARAALSTALAKLEAAP